MLACKTCKTKGTVVYSWLACKGYRCVQLQRVPLCTAVYRCVPLCTVVYRCVQLQRVPLCTAKGTVVYSWLACADPWLQMLHAALAPLSSVGSALLHSLIMRYARTSIILLCATTAQNGRARVDLSHAFTAQYGRADALALPHAMAARCGRAGTPPAACNDG